MGDMVQIDLDNARRLLARVDDGEGADIIPAGQAEPFAVAMAAQMMMREGAEALESFLLTLEQGECPVIHHFGPGLYWREVSFPAGVLAMGHRQRHSQTNIMLAGRATMIGEDGAAQTIAAPSMGVGAPGRKVGVIHEAVTWLNVYPNPDNCQDVETLEARLIDKTDDAAAAVAAVRMTAETAEDRLSYLAVLDGLGLTQAQAQADMDRGGPVVPLPWGAYKCRTAPSPINGQGLFATAPIAPGEVIAPAVVGGRKTIAGRYTNHGAVPNAEFRERADGGLDLVAVRLIGGNRGGFDGEEILIDYRAAVLLSLSRREVQA